MSCKMTLHVYYVSQHICTIISHCLILPPPPTVEDAMDVIVLTLYCLLELGFQFEEYQDKLQ